MTVIPCRWQTRFSLRCTIVPQEGAALLRSGHRRHHPSSDQHRFSVRRISILLVSLPFLTNASILIFVIGPFFSLIFAALFLRDVERVTLRIVLSAAMIIGGVVLLTLWK